MADPLGLWFCHVAGHRLGPGLGIGYLFVVDIALAPLWVIFYLFVFSYAVLSKTNAWES
jgi:hypothetical protein